MGLSLRIIFLGGYSVEKIPEEGCAYCGVIIYCVQHLVSGAVPEASAQEKKKGNQNEIKNVIVLIGDGMGVSYTSAHRYLKDNKKTKVVEPTAFDQYLVGQQTTYPEDPEQNVTDSASAATAMSAGIKTYNNAIAVDNDGSEVKTVLEAKKRKRKINRACRHFRNYTRHSGFFLLA